MADPLTAAELEHARWLAANRPDVSSRIVARLLDTLDARLDDQLAAHVGVLRDMREAGVLTLDRRKWASFLRGGEEGRFAYVAFAGMTAEEIVAYYAANPLAQERDRATGRRLAAELDAPGGRVPLEEAPSRDAWRAARGAVPNLGAPSEEIIREARGGEL